MVGRPQRPPGELGKVSFSRKGEFVSARAYARGAGGQLHRLQAQGASEAEAQLLLAKRASLLAMTGDITPDTPLRDLLQLWIQDREARVRPQTIRMYRDTVRWLTPFAGSLTVVALRPATLKKMLLRIEKERSPSAAHHARVALSGALALAVEEDVIATNPVRSLRRREPVHTVPVALGVIEVQELRAAVLRRERRVLSTAGTGAASVLRWVIEVQLGAGLRIAEVLGLRMMDYDAINRTVTVLGTLVDNADWQVVRQAELKGRGQARRIELPHFAARAIEEAIRHTPVGGERQATDPLLQARAPGWISPRNVRRAMRTLQSDPALTAAFEAAGVRITQLTPHVLRRTAATLVAAESGDLSHAQSLLGHSDIRTTLQHYAGSAYRTVGSAAALDSILGQDTM
jgi:integrase